jgi:hypothetical protein
MCDGVKGFHEDRDFMNQVASDLESPTADQEHPFAIFFSVNASAE